MNPIIHHSMNYSQKNSCINYRENSVACLWAKSELTLFTTTTFFLHSVPPNIKQLAFTHIKRLVNAFPCSLRLRRISEFHSYSQFCLFIYRLCRSVLRCMCTLQDLNLYYRSSCISVLCYSIFTEVLPIELSVPRVIRTYQRLLHMHIVCFYIAQ